MATPEERFFAINSPPSSLSANRKEIEAFVTYHLEQGRKLAFVTSGGTTVPLEKNTVRFLDNFSGGRRGACSAEEFLSHGYAVIFLHRLHSLQPFARHFVGDFFQYFAQSESGNVQISPAFQPKLDQVIDQYYTSKRTNMLLQVPFFSLQDYIYYLREIACLIRPFGPKNLIYLAAAVSDFYIPEPSMDEHKIQSREKESGLDVHFEPVPKMLGHLVNDWCPGSYTISFKLETREDLLESKALSALGYGQQMVIANLLKNHSTRVVFYRPNQEPFVIEQPDKSKEIEKLFIPQIIGLHDSFIAQISNSN